MAVVVFLRGVNVGGHKTFRPTLLAKQLRAYDAVNIGAAGTFVVRKPGDPKKFRSVLLSKLSVDAQVSICQGKDIVQFADDDPFSRARAAPDLVRFVSILPRRSALQKRFPIVIPETGECLVRVLGVRKQFVYGFYRRNMKTIGCLGQIDKLFGAPATTRGWKTILSIVEMLRR